MVVFAVLSDGTGWGCISEHGDKNYKECNSTLAPLYSSATSYTEYCQ